MKIPTIQPFRLLMAGAGTIIGAAPLTDSFYEKDLHPKDAEPPLPVNTSIGYFIAAILHEPTTLQVWKEVVANSATWDEASEKMVALYGGIQFQANREGIQELKESLKSELTISDLIRNASHLPKGEA